ncbi:uncharacterized protein LOC124649901 isoform X2 [Lolium rigidum]|uniref:uncharacterized protein LOC124649901 isoform X2 n=1 Tax=Lolium rigidum TaxID=89674 RepID=UPI001F5D4C83|nr:uncharacterized protein LOC124649901 isoform X2 [Lolium rigidum]
MPPTPTRQTLVVGSGGGAGGAAANTSTSRCILNARGLNLDFPTLLLDGLDFQLEPLLDLAVPASPRCCGGALLLLLMIQYYLGYLHDDYYVFLAYDLSFRCCWTGVVSPNHNHGGGRHPSGISKDDQTQIQWLRDSRRKKLTHPACSPCFHSWYMASLLHVSTTIYLKRF